MRENRHIQKNSYHHEENTRKQKQKSEWREIDTYKQFYHEYYTNAGARRKEGGGIKKTKTAGRDVNITRRALMHICVYICIYRYICLYTYIYMRVHIYANIYLCTYTHKYIYTRNSTRIAHMHICVHIYIYRYIHISIHMCIYT